MADQYMLGEDGRTPVKCFATDEWGRWMQGEKNRVGEDHIAGVCISTVFLGLDHNHFISIRGGEPILFETMTFGPDPWDGEIERCSTYDQAEAMHKRMVERVTAWANERIGPAFEQHG